MAKQQTKEEKLEAGLLAINKMYGEGTIMTMDDAKIMNVEIVPTGNLALDIALGVGGLPRGRIIEIYGPESSGKSTFAMHVVAEAQRAGGICAYVDAEHAMDPIYAEAIGVDTDKLLVSQPDTAEQILGVVETLVKTGALSVIVVDSVAALTPRAELEGEMGDSHVGLMARLMNQALRKLTGEINKTQTIVIFINQIRYKIGVMFGSPETTPGGNGLKFYSSVRLDIRRTGQLKKGDDVIGSETKIKVIKNKVAPPFKVALFEIIYGEGVSRTGTLIDIGTADGVIKKSGSWYSYKDIQIGQGKEKAKDYLADNPQMTDEIERTVRIIHGLPVDGQVVTIQVPEEDEEVPLDLED